MFEGLLGLAPSRYAYKLPVQYMLLVAGEGRDGTVESSGSLKGLFVFLSFISKGIDKDRLYAAWSHDDAVRYIHV